MHTHTDVVSADALPLRTSLRRTLFIEVFCLMAFLIVLFTGVACILASAVIEQRAWHMLETTLSRQADGLQESISRQREQISLLASDPLLSRLPSVVQLVGFQSLLSLDATGTIRTIAGADPAKDTLPTMRARAPARGFVPVFSGNRLAQYIIAAPRPDGQSSIVAVFDASAFLSNYLDVSALGTSAESAVIIPQEQRFVRLTHVPDGPITSEVIAEDSELASRISDFGSSGRVQVSNTVGSPVLLVRRPLVSLGWMMSVEITRSEVFAPYYSLAFNLIAAGLGLVGFLSLLMFSFSRRISAPLEDLYSKLKRIETKHWRFVRSVRTGDELEAVDIAAADLTQRLRSSHRRLAALIRRRTSELISNHERSDVILQNIEYGVLVTDNKGRIILMNSAAEHITGWDFESVSRQSFSRVMRIVDEEHHAVPLSKHPLTFVLKHCKKYHPQGESTFSLLSKDDRITPLSLRVTPVIHGTKCIGAVAVIRDVTEERRIEHLKTDFISLASHQLRTPLSALRWHLELLASAQNGTLNDKQMECLEQASTSTVRMVKLVDALLNASRIELGNYSLTNKEIRPHTLLKQIVETFSQQIASKNIHIVYRSISERMISIDPIFLQLILENLISNAIKYSLPSGTVTLDCRVRANTHISFSVADTGIGIPALQHKRVFEKLFRADNVKASDTDGNGLGLYISQVSAEVLGGSLTFKSAEGKGSVFTLTVPIGSKKGALQKK